MSDLLDRALAELRARREDARCKGIELIGVIGSVARGEDRPDSDVDVAYDVVGPASLLTLGGLLMDLQDALGRRVDMVDISMVRESRRRSMERDLVRA